MANDDINARLDRIEAILCGVLQELERRKSTSGKLYVNELVSAKGDAWVYQCDFRPVASKGSQADRDLDNNWLVLDDV